ncbi:MFS general substrate transporter [Aspergillus cavernicola]|uniref:MFS general substrate transporter n=1 Tax=Aspergillus cavernicola TaxID=176166 RepID=A0ABR4HSR2_9EURO
MLTSSSLHGGGTNSRIFELQTAAIRYELGDNHTYDFVEGTIPCQMYPGVERIALEGEPVYAFMDPQKPETGVTAYQNLEEYLEEEGPYDGVIAFSQAATMILTYLVYVARQNALGHHNIAPFRFAIFISVVQSPIDYEALGQGQLIEIRPEHAKGAVEIPTVHIWGALDSDPKGASRAAELCRDDMKWIYVHERGHEVPGAGIFLSAAEITIISTSLVTITDELMNHEQGSWLITAYLLTFTGFLTLWAKCPHVYGLKTSLLSSLLIFVAFSGGCGAVQTMNQLIICRAFQGIGGSGVFSLSLFSLIRIARPGKFDAVSATGSAVVAIGMVLGAILGGAICSAGAWRWVFLYNVPAGAVAWVLICFAVPNNFAHPSMPERRAGIWNYLSQRTKLFLTTADPVGCFLLLGFSILFVTALEEANVTYEWSSALIIGFLTVSGVLGITFVLWEWYIGSQRKGVLEPMFPWRMVRDRVWMGVLLLVLAPFLNIFVDPRELLTMRLSGFFVSGPATTILYIQIPQRLQTTNDSSPLSAGVKLLAFALGSPAGSFLCTLFAGKFHLPFVHIIMMGAVLQTIGSFLLSSVPTTLQVWGGQYGYMVLTGIGVGMSMTSFYMAVPMVVRKDDQLIAVGMSLQARMLGASLGIAIVNSILINYVKAHINPIEAAADPNALSGFAPDAVQRIREVYGAGYNLQMKAVGGFSAAQFLAVALMWKKDQARFVK